MPPPPTPLILASRSPRRAALLREAGIPFEIVPTPDREAAPGQAPHLTPPEVTLLNASRKACPLARAMPGRLVLGVDTEVALDLDIFGKPRDTDHARAMLRRLSGREHSVHTALVFAMQSASGLKTLAWIEVTRVRFRELGDDDIDAYLAGVHVLDKAGAYAIQEHGDRLAASIDGLVSNVVGLPVERIPALLRQFDAAP